MAGRRPPSDLGSDWINVPRKFRGIKDTSSPTELAYITGAEKGLLSRFANANQVGPENIPSFDDSGMSEDFDWSDYDKKKKSGWTPKETVKTPTSIWLGKGVGSKTITSPTQNKIDRGITKDSPFGTSKTYGVTNKEVKDEDRMSGPEMTWDPPDDDIDEDNKTGGDETTGGNTGCNASNCDFSTHKCVGGNCVPKTTEGDKCAGKSTDCPSDKPNGKGVCDPDTGNVDFSSCTADDCPYGKDPATGKCKDKPVDEDANGDPPSLTTIIQPDEIPTLQELTSDMDLRNMLTNVLNKNNPLFKQAKTRALQAMAARGVANSSMAEEAVMSSIMNVAMPIATRVIDDLQRVMAANVNASNAFKMALNQAYYNELLKRVDAANTWNLERMKAQQVNWQAMLEMKGKAADISDEEVFKDYMDMLKTTPGYHDQPTWNVGQT